ncbi:unnamed protein product [Ectocarpus fasciculatus]
MQTPLETLGAGSFVAFELKEKGEHKERTLSWGAYHLNPDEVNSRPESLCAYAGIPPALVRLEPSEFSLVGDAIITKANPSPRVTAGTIHTTAAAAAATDDEEEAAVVSSTEGDPVLSLPSPCPANNAG